MHRRACRTRAHLTRVRVRVRSRGRGRGRVRIRARARVRVRVRVVDLARTAQPPHQPSVGRRLERDLASITRGEIGVHAVEHNVEPASKS